MITHKERSGEIDTKKMSDKLLRNQIETTSWNWFFFWGGGSGSGKTLFFSCNLQESDELILLSW